MSVLDDLRYATAILWDMDETQLQQVAPEDRQEVLTLLSRVLSAGNSLQDAVCEWEDEDEDEEEDEPRDFVVERELRLLNRDPEDPDTEH